MEIILLGIYVYVASVCYARLPYSMSSFTKLVWSLMWPITFLFFWTTVFSSFFFKEKLSERRRKKDTYQPIPSDWLCEETYDDIGDLYRKLYGTDIEDHQSVPWRHMRDAKDWDRIIALYSPDSELRAFDSGFCKGIALIEGGQVIDYVTIFHFRPQV